MSVCTEYLSFDVEDDRESKLIFLRLSNALRLLGVLCTENLSFEVEDDKESTLIFLRLSVLRSLSVLSLRSFGALESL